MYTPRFMGKFNYLFNLLLVFYIRPRFIIVVNVDHMKLMFFYVPIKNISIMTGIYNTVSHLFSFDIISLAAVAFTLIN